MASETRLAIGQARMRRRRSAAYGRILGMWALACQLEGLPACSASIVREERPADAASAAPRLTQNGGPAQKKQAMLPNG